MLCCIHVLQICLYSTQASEHPSPRRTAGRAILAQLGGQQRDLVRQQPQVRAAAGPNGARVPQCQRTPALPPASAALHADVIWARTTGAQPSTSPPPAAAALALHQPPSVAGAPCGPHLPTCSPYRQYFSHRSQRVAMGVTLLPWGRPRRQRTCKCALPHCGASCLPPALLQACMHSASARTPSPGAQTSACGWQHARAADMPVCRSRGGACL